MSKINPIQSLLLIATYGDIEVWSDRPLFLWQESMVGIEVRHQRSNNLMWSESLEADTRSIIYAGDSLQPGQVYYWRKTLPLEEVAHRVSLTQPPVP